MSAPFTGAAGWRKLKISVRELLLLMKLTGIDPFAAPDIGAAPTALPIIRLLDHLLPAAQGRRDEVGGRPVSDLESGSLGQSAPKAAQITEFARTIRADFAGIEDQFAATEDPGGDILRARMTLVYGQEAADAFLALVEDVLVLDVAYSHPAPALEVSITAADPALSYDDFSHRLSHKGLLSAATCADGGARAETSRMVAALTDAGLDAVASFFSRFPELKPLYGIYRLAGDACRQADRCWQRSA